MKKTIKTGLMIALFIVCIFLLLPFVITERTHEQKDEQLRTAQPQVYSSNPLTAFFQRAKDLLASHHTHKDSADAKSKAARTARAAQKHQDKNQNNPNNVLAAQRAEQTGNAQGSNGYGYSSNYTPKNYDFALYERPTQNKQTSSDSLFEQTPVENRKATLHPFAANAARFAGVLGLNAGRGTKSVATANNHTADFAQNALAAAKRNSQRSNNTISALTSASQQDTDKMIYDIVKMRADAKFPNPQTQAERLARDEFMKAETERYRQHLRDLYRRSVIDPDNPDVEPDPENFSENDPLGSIIIDEETHSTVKSAAFTLEKNTDAALNGDIATDILSDEVFKEVLAENNISLEDLSKEELASFTEKVPLMVILGTTTDETHQKVQQELALLQQQEEKAGQKGENADEAAPQDQGQNNDDPVAQYKKTLQDYDTFLSTICKDGCFWVAAQNRATMKDLVNTINTTNAEFVGDPLGREGDLFGQYIQDKLPPSKPAGSSTTGKHTATAGDDEDEDEDETDAGYNSNPYDAKSLILNLAADFDKLMPYIPYTREDIRELNNPQANTDNANSDTKEKTRYYYVSNLYQAHQLQDDLDNSSMWVDPKSFEQHLSSQDFKRALYQAQLNNLKANQEANEFLEQEEAKGTVENVSAKVSQKLEKTDKNKTKNGGQK